MVCPSKNVGRNLKRILKIKGYSQQYFAGMANVEVRTVGRWVNDGINQIDLIAFVAHTLGVRLIDLISDDEVYPLYRHFCRGFLTVRAFALYGLLFFINCIGFCFCERSIESQIASQSASSINTFATSFLLYANEYKKCQWSFIAA